MKKILSCLVSVSTIFLLNCNLYAAGAEIKINSDFPGSNVLVRKNAVGTVDISADLRGGNPWFYWYFEAECIEPGNVEFSIDKPPAMSARGPALSLDGGKTWSWLGAESVKFAPPPGKDAPKNPKDFFTYEFKAKNQKVLFCASIPYMQNNLDDFLKRNASNPNMSQSILCKTAKGLPVELLQIGKPGPGVKAVLMAARNHACESVASYALEGLMEEAISESPAALEFRKKYVLYVVPMVDKDGVQAGDQGKGRSPHDHNRDYGAESIYPEVKAIQELAESKNVELVLDFHDPFIRGEDHTIFAFYGIKLPHNFDNTNELARWMGEEGPQMITRTSVWFKAPENPPPTKGLPLASYYVYKKNIIMSATLETPYTVPGFPFDASMARAYGAGVLKAWTRTNFIRSDAEAARSDDFEKLAAFRKNFQSIYKSKPAEAEELAKKQLDDPNAPALYKAEANNLMGDMRLHQKKYTEALKCYQNTFSDKNASTNQRFTALTQSLIASCRNPDSSPAEVEKFTAEFEKLQYPATTQKYETSGAISAYYERLQNYEKALLYAKQQALAASKYDKGKTLLAMAALHDKLQQKDKAIEVRKEAVEYLRKQLDPVPVGVFGPNMANDLFEALCGIPDATLEEKKEAANIVLNHKISPAWLKDKISKALAELEKK